MAEDDLRRLIGDHGFSIANLSYRLSDGGKICEYGMVIKSRDRTNADALSQHLCQLPEVLEFSDRADGRLTTAVLWHRLLVWQLMSRWPGPPDEATAAGGPLMLASFIRVGLNSGELVVRAIGSDLHEVMAEEGKTRERVPSLPDSRRNSDATRFRGQGIG
jgi:hypothetical protein